MCQHETKKCPRCNAAFECKPGNITQCQCFGITISNELKKHIEERYSDCLCRACLLQLQNEVMFFKEKFILR